MHASPTTKEQRSGFSLPEILVSISIVAILAAIALSSFGNLSAKSKSGAGEAYVETLNRAVFSYNQCGSTINVLANGASVADEQSVIALLTTKDNDVPGTPYLGGNAPSTGSSSTADLRARWNGRTFELLDKGVAGSGLDLKL